jgi:hypothetical protein
VTASTEITPCSTPPPEPETEVESKRQRSRSDTVSSVRSGRPPSEVTLDDSSSTKSSGFRPGSLKRTSTTGKGSVDLNADGETLPGHQQLRERDGDWGIGDEARMGLE